jgi:hypothetical protein
MFISTAATILALKVTAVAATFIRPAVHHFRFI